METEEKLLILLRIFKAITEVLIVELEHKLNSNYNRLEDKEQFDKSNPYRL